MYQRHKDLLGGDPFKLIPEHTGRENPDLAKSYPSAPSVPGHPQTVPNGQAGPVMPSPTESSQGATSDFPATITMAPSDNIILNDPVPSTTTSFPCDIESPPRWGFNLSPCLDRRAHSLREGFVRPAASPQEMFANTPTWDLDTMGREAARSSYPTQDVFGCALDVGPPPLELEQPVARQCSFHQEPSMPAFTSATYHLQFSPTTTSYSHSPSSSPSSQRSVPGPSSHLSSSFPLNRFPSTYP